ncbi:MAG TPA: PspC domain-containing protein [Candidatus Nanopusillus sp.]|nr:PspC domain-containing protein [Candidatus Nanopusillus sp.]
MMKRLTLGKDKLLFGVCSGIAEYFNLDPNLVRLIYVLLALIAPRVFIPLYIIAAIILPEKNEKEKKQS